MTTFVQSWSHFRRRFRTSVVILGVVSVVAICSRGEAQLQSVCGSEGYLNSIPIPPPKKPGTHRQLQLVNCSDQVILGASNAAHRLGLPETPVFPQEGTWVMQPYGSPNFANVLTIDVPQEWEGVEPKSGGLQPNLWARTGCRYDVVTNRAQCETGDCGGQYDCSSAGLSPSAGTTLAEWTFYQQIGNYFIDSPDISAVNGANLTIDIAPHGGSNLDPNSQTDFHWLNWNYPLTVHGVDLREPSLCTGSGGNFRLQRSDIPQTQDNLNPDYPLLGFVIVDGSGQPTMPSGNNPLACLSNCGFYKFPVEKGEDGCDATTHANCYAWKTFCAGSKDLSYGQSCSVDSDCYANNINGGIDFHIACFHNSGPNGPGACEVRGFYKGTVSQCNKMKDPQPTGPASTVACTNTYGSVNPLDTSVIDYADQPPITPCTAVNFPPNQKTGTKQVPCIGDDTLHAVLHGAYTWPNDPQVYASDAPVYRIIFSPGGNNPKTAPITLAQALPLCSSLPDNYHYGSLGTKGNSNLKNCSIPVNNENAVFGIGVVANITDNKNETVQWQSTGIDWPCSLVQRGSGANGVVCYWNPPPKGNCSPPATDADITQGACGRIDSGTQLQSSSITPNNSDPLILEVSIPKVLNSVSLPATVSGCVPAQGVGSWSLVTSKAVGTDHGIIAWYKGTANASLSCSVLVTITSENPAELKLYDVPKFNGTIETSSSGSGEYTSGATFPSIDTGSAITTHADDLQLGALLLVNEQRVPITYWENWLGNSAPQDYPKYQCQGFNTICPKDDGTDYLPGHGSFSSNSDVGHRNVAPGTQYFHRDGEAIGMYSWAASAIYLELNP